MVQGDAMRFYRWLWLPALAFMLLSGGCLTRLSVDRSGPPAVALEKHQPTAILPAADAPGFAGSGALLTKEAGESLAAKNFTVVAPERSLRALLEMNRSAPEVSRNPIYLRWFGDSLAARLVLLASFIDFRTQKSYVSSRTFQVWQGASYEYHSLPTYYQGMSEMKIRLKLLDPQTGGSVWESEGSARGPAGSEEEILRRLAADLLLGLPPLPGKGE
jgi:hypothetical protein